MKKPTKPSKAPKGKGIIITAEIAADDIERLHKAFADGELEPFGVTEITVSSSPGENVPIGQWSKAESERRQTGQHEKKPRGK